jgi:hypothetical protein
VALAALILLPVVLAIAASRHGIGMLPDSVSYVAAARSFAEDWQFTYWDGTPFSHWPFGLPLILGVLLKAGVDPTVSALLINVLGAGAVVALTYLIGRHLLASPRLALVLAGIAAVALPFARAFSQLLSEPLFIVVSLAAVWLLTRVVRDGARWQTVAAVAVLVTVACSVRYIGVALIPVVGLSLLVAEARRGLPQALAISALGTALSSVGAAAVMLRNLIVVGSATGSWVTSQVSPAHLLRKILGAIGQWIVPGATLTSGVALVVGIAIVAAAAYGAFCLARTDGVRRQAVPLLVFVASYLGVLVVGELKVDGFIDYRYLAPMLVPMTLLVVAGVWNLWRLAAGPGARPVGPGPRSAIRQAAAVVLVVAVVAVGGVYGVSNARKSVTWAYQVGQSGFGYNSAEVRASKLAAFAGALPTSTGLLSNDPMIIYWVTGRHPIPSSSLLAKASDPGGAVRAKITAGTLTYYVEFTKPQTAQGVSADTLRGWGVALGDPVSYPDGTLYRMSAAPGS